MLMAIAIVFFSSADDAWATGVTGDSGAVDAVDMVLTVVVDVERCALMDELDDDDAVDVERCALMDELDDDDAVDVLLFIFLSLLLITLSSRFFSGLAMRSRRVC